MHEWNFDSLKHIKTPQAWLDKAAAIPETAEKKRVIPLYRIAAAASIVLVSVIGLLLFLFLGDGKAPIAVRSRSIAASETSMEDAAGETTATGEPVPRETIAVLSTDADGNPVIVYQEKPASTERGTQPTGGRRTPTENAPSPTTSSAPTTPRATDAPDQPAPAAERPPAQTEAPAVPDAPATEPLPTQKSTEAYTPPGDCEIYGMFRMNTVSGSGYNVAEDLGVFCRLYDSSGSLVGDSPLYSPQREATILSIYDDGTVVAYYNPSAKGLLLTEDAYEYVFYDVHGNELYHDIKFVF